MAGRGQMAPGRGGEDGGAEGDSGPLAGSGEADEQEDVRCALVEFDGGSPARKWTLELGRTYEVGRAGGGADIEVDHQSISRRRCCT